MDSGWKVPCLMPIRVKELVVVQTFSQTFFHKKKFNFTCRNSPTFPSFEFAWHFSMQAQYTMGPFPFRSCNWNVSDFKILLIFIVIIFLQIIFRDNFDSNSYKLWPYCVVCSLHYCLFIDVNNTFLAVLVC